MISLKFSAGIRAVKKGEETHAGVCACTKANKTTRQDTCTDKIVPLVEGIRAKAIRGSSALSITL